VINRIKARIRAVDWMEEGQEVHTTEQSRERTGQQLS
jgi:hypothetical protein